MKKLLCLAMSVLLVLSALPVVSFEDVSGTVIIQNETSATYNTLPGFYANGKISPITTADAYMDTLNPEAGDAIKLTGAGTGCRWTVEKDQLTEGAYEVYFYNISEGSEVWRAAGSAEAIKERYAKYTVMSANGKSVYYINQATASGDSNGWVKLGTFQFSGKAGEGVRLDKIYIENRKGIAYADDVKFVPVNSSKAKLSHIYTTIDNTQDDVDNGIQVNADLTDIGDETHLTVRVPYGSDSASVVVEAASPSSAIYVTPKDGSATSYTGSAVITPDIAAQMNYYKVNVINGADVARYTLTIEVEQSAGTKIDWAESNTYSGVSDKSTYDKNYGSFTRFVEPAETIGWYNVYAEIPADRANNYVNTPYLNVLVDHNGLREEVTIPYGRYKTAQSVYIGKYYFTNRKYGEYREIITFMQSTNHASDISQIRLVPTVADDYAPSFLGISFPKGDGINSISKEGIEHGRNWTTDASASTGVILHQANTTMHPFYSLNGSTPARLQINKSDDSLNRLTMSAGDNTLDIIYYANNQDGEIAEKYTVHYYGQSGNVTVIDGCQAVATGSTNGNFFAPISSNYYGNAKQTAAPANLTGENVMYTPNLTSSSIRRVLAWNPTFREGDGNSFNSTVQQIEVTEGGVTKTKTVDWQSGPSGWVDLGVYDFSSETDNVKIVNNEGGNGLLYNKVIFAVPTQGLTALDVDGTVYSEGELDGKMFVTGDSQINLTPVALGGVSINGEPASNEVATAINLNLGVNNVKITAVDSQKEYNITVVSTGHIAHFDDASNDTAPALFEGYNGTESAYITGASASAVFNAPATSGRVKVYVYQVAATTDADAAESASVTGAVEGTINNTAAQSGWVEIGECTLSGNGTETVTINGVDGKNVYINCVKFEVAEDIVFTAPEFTFANGKVTVKMSYYNKSNSAKSFSAILADYSSDKLLDTVNTNLLNAPAQKVENAILTVNASALDNIKLYIWESMYTLKPITDVIIPS